MEGKEIAEVLVVNDIGVILRIQGHTYEAVEIYEPIVGGAVSILKQQITSHLQGMGAVVLGRLMADALMKVPGSELGKRLHSPEKWLVNVMAAQSRQFSNFRPTRPMFVNQGRAAPTITL